MAAISGIAVAVGVLNVLTSLTPLTSGAAGSADEPAPVETDRVRYEARESDGDVAVDSSTFENDGRLWGQVSRRNGSYRFHPLNGRVIYDRIRTATDPSFNPRSKPFSYGARIKVQPDATWSHSEMAVIRHGDTDTPGGDYKLEIEKRKSGIVVAFCAIHDGDGGSSYVEGRGSLETLADGGWHRITCVRVDEDTVALVVDDHVVTKDLAEPMGAIRGNKDPLFIGCQPFANRPELKFREQFVGAMDDIHVTVDPSPLPAPTE